MPEFNATLFAQLLNEDKWQEVEEILETRPKTRVQWWNVKNGVIWSNRVGETSEYLNSLDNLTAIFLGRAPVRVDWKPTQFIDAYVVDNNSSVEYVNTTSALSGQPLIKAVKAISWTLFIKASDWFEGAEWKFYSVLQHTGLDLYSVSQDSIYTPTGDVKYITLSLQSINNRLAVLDLGEIQQYIHFNKPLASWVKPTYDATQPIYDDKWGSTEVPRTAFGSYQIDIIGKNILSGIALNALINEAEGNFPENRELLVPLEALTPLNTLTDNYTDTQQSPVFLTGLGLERRGQWDDWKAKLRADQGLISERPQFQGLLTYGQYYTTSPDFTISTTQETEFRLWHLSQTSAPGQRFYVSVYTTPSPANGQPGEIDFLFFQSQSEGWRFPYDLAYALQQNLNALSNFANNGQGIPVEKYLRLEPVISQTPIGNTAPLFGDERFSFNASFKTPNIVQSLTTTTFTEFLALNTIANFDTPILPVEISENLTIDPATFPSFIGSLWRLVTFGIPVIFQTEINRTTTGYYDRKYHGLMNRSTFSLLSTGFFGATDTARRIAIDENLPNISDIGQSSSYRFKYGVWVKRDDGSANIVPMTNGPAQPNDLVSLDAATIWIIGNCYFRLTFFDNDGISQWQGIYQTRSKQLGDLRYWMTTLTF